jgi:hypothetical protein
MRYARRLFFNLLAKGQWMSFPPGIKPAGSRLSSQAKADVARVRRIQDAMVGDVQEREKRKERRKGRAVDHHEGKQFRDGHGVLREKNGRFATETVSPHKRSVKRIPWSKPAASE